MRRFVFHFLGTLLWLTACAGCLGPHPHVIEVPFDSGLPDGGLANDAGELDAGMVTGDGGMVEDGGHLRWRKVLELPQNRSVHAAFFWPPTKSTFVLSGNHATGPIHDFWEWNGQDWRRAPLTEQECPPRKNAAVAVDADAGYLYVFGGVWSGYPLDGGSYTVTPMGDFRRWDGAQWEALNPPSKPAPRSGSAMTFDEAHQELVLFGGADNTPAGRYSDTWTYSGGRWTQRTLTADAHPSTRFNVRSVYDSHRGRVVLFGGQMLDAQDNVINYDDTWEWDSTLR